MILPGQDIEVKGCNWFASSENNTNKQLAMDSAGSIPAQARIDTQEASSCLFEVSPVHHQKGENSIHSLPSTKHQTPPHNLPHWQFPCISPSLATSSPLEQAGTILCKRGENSAKKSIVFCVFSYAFATTYLSQTLSNVIQVSTGLC